MTRLLDLETGAREVFREAQAPFSGDGYVLKQVRYTSNDGTSAPMYIAHRARHESWPADVGADRVRGGGGYVSVDADGVDGAGSRELTEADSQKL